MKNIINILFAVCSLTSLVGQSVEWQPLTREIVLDQGDSVIRFRILVEKEDIKLNDNYIYYWYNDDQINKNQGDYSGDVLHGSYQVFNVENKLITKGQFEKGVKTGVWKKWYPNSNIKRIEHYSKGKINGKTQVFDMQGYLIEEKEFRNGELVLKENKLFKIFTKDDSYDSTQINIDNQQSIENESNTDYSVNRDLKK